MLLIGTPTDRAINARLGLFSFYVATSDIQLEKCVFLGYHFNTGHVCDIGTLEFFTSTSTRSSKNLTESLFAKKLIWPVKRGSAPVNETLWKKLAELVFVSQ